MRRTTLTIEDQVFRELKKKAGLCKQSPTTFSADP
jgi:hypothetical protein